MKRFNDKQDEKTPWNSQYKMIPFFLFLSSKTLFLSILMKTIIKNIVTFIKNCISSQLFVSCQCFRRRKESFSQNLFSFCIRASFYDIFLIDIRGDSASQAWNFLPFFLRVFFLLPLASHKHISFCMWMFNAWGKKNK